MPPTAVYSHSKGTVAQGTGTTLSPSVPSNLQKDDVVIVPVWERGSTLGTPTVTANSGALSFTSKTSITITSTLRLTLFWYRVAATVPTSISVALSGSNRKAAVAINMRGCARTGDPLTVATGQNAAGSGAQTRTTPNVDTSAVGVDGGYIMGVIGTANQVTGGYAESSTPENGLWVEELAEFNNASASTMAGAVGGGATNGTADATQGGVAFTFTPSASTTSCYITAFLRGEPLPSAPTDGTDNFNRSENPVGSPWVHDPVEPRMQANGSILVPLATQAEEYYPINYTSDDVARVRVKIPTNGAFGIGFVDVADNAALNGYFVYATGFSVDLYKLGRGAGGGGDAVIGGGNPTAGIPSGDSIEFEWDMPNDTLRVWWVDSSPATAYLLATQVDATWDYHQAKYVLLYSDGATSTYDDFAVTLPASSVLHEVTLTASVAVGTGRRVKAKRSLSASVAAVVGQARRTSRTLTANATVAPTVGRKTQARRVAATSVTTPILPRSTSARRAAPVAVGTNVARRTSITRTAQVAVAAMLRRKASVAFAALVGVTLGVASAIVPAPPLVVPLLLTVTVGVGARVGRTVYTRRRVDVAVGASALKRVARSFVARVGVLTTLTMPGRVQMLLVVTVGVGASVGRKVKATRAAQVAVAARRIIFTPRTFVVTVVAAARGSRTTLKRVRTNVGVEARHARLTAKRAVARVQVATSRRVALTRLLVARVAVAAQQDARRTLRLLLIAAVVVSSDVNRRARKTATAVVGVTAIGTRASDAIRRPMAHLRATVTRIGSRIFGTSAQSGPRPRGTSQPNDRPYGTHDD